MGSYTPREKVLAAFEMRDEGLSFNRIRRTLGVGNGTVERWFAYPEMNPYLDSVAIDRAVRGDIKVYDALTVFERERVHGLLNEEWAKAVVRFTGNQHMEADPGALLWARFGPDANRVKHNCAGYRDMLAARARRAAA